MKIDKYGNISIASHSLEEKLLRDSKWLRWNLAKHEEANKSLQNKKKSIYRSESGLVKHSN